MVFSKDQRLQMQFAATTKKYEPTLCAGSILRKEIGVELSENESEPCQTE